MNEFIFPLKIYIEDTDYGGVVYHANYLKFYERARTEWIAQLGLGFAWQKQHNIFFVVHSINIDYLRPIRLDDTVEVVSRLEQISAASIVFQQYLRSSVAPDTILNKAAVKIVCVNEKFRPQKCPPSQLQAILTGDKT